MSSGWTKYMQLDANDAESTSTARWNDTAPTASVFSIGDDNQVNNSSYNYIAYCFHSVEGYSKLGSYTGNGNDDGTFIYT